jgi:hypothetical protein
VILLSAWVYEHLEMSTICLIDPTTKLAVGEKLLLSVAHQIVRWFTEQCTVHCPVHLAVGLTLQATVGA